MIIEEGKYYKMRNGDKAGPVTFKCGEWISDNPIDCYRPMWHKDTGVSNFTTFGGESDFPEYDLIEEWVEPNLNPEWTSTPDPMPVLHPEEVLEDESGMSIDGGFSSRSFRPEDDYTWKWPTLSYVPETCVSLSGGPNRYYDFPYSEWKTTNDQMEYLSENKWGKYGIHLKDVFKGLCRWGDKSGTTIQYDAEKIIYYGCRVLRMISGNEKLRSYLQELLDDPQFK